jgi:hypothetical protein
MKSVIIFFANFFKKEFFMKKQLLALSAMFVVFAAQGSFYERMKAAAKEKYEQAKQAYEKYMPQAQEFYTKYVKQHVPTITEYAKTTILPVGQEFVTSQLLDEDVTDLFAGVPYGSDALDKVRTLYMSKFYPEFKKKITTEAGKTTVQWEKPAPAVK